MTEELQNYWCSFWYLLVAFCQQPEVNFKCEFEWRSAKCITHLSKIMCITSRQNKIDLPPSMVVAS